MLKPLQLLKHLLEAQKVLEVYGVNYFTYLRRQLHFFFVLFHQLGPPPPNILPFLVLTGKVKLPLSTKLVVTFSEGDARQDNTDVCQGPLVVTPRPITRLETKQALKGERGNSP